MLANYLKIAVRNFRRYWSQSIINVLGLTIGFLSVILITLYIDHETNFDRFHTDFENIFRLTDPWGGENGYTRPAIVPPPWGEALAGEFPEIERYTRIDKRLRFNPLVANGTTKFFEDGFISVDSTFFQLFNFT
ncbi:MAG: ABC transporter permease, partial [Cyclobacteriaceae bacterium]